MGSDDVSQDGKYYQSESHQGAKGAQRLPTGEAKQAAGRGPRRRPPCRQV